MSFYCLCNYMYLIFVFFFFFFFQAEDGIRDLTVTGVQTCALPISHRWRQRARHNGNHPFQSHLSHAPRPGQIFSGPHGSAGHGRSLRLVDGRFFLRLGPLHCTICGRTRRGLRTSPQARTKNGHLRIPYGSSRRRSVLRQLDDHRSLRQDLQRGPELSHADDLCRHHPCRRRHASRRRAYSRTFAHSYPQRQPSLQRACRRHLPLEFHRHHFHLDLRLRRRRPLPRYQNVPARICPLPLLISPDCVFDASLVPETCRDRFVDSKELINKFLERSVAARFPLLQRQPQLRPTRRKSTNCSARIAASSVVVAGLQTGASFFSCAAQPFLTVCVCPIFHHSHWNL